jgi:hypothetical protein
MKVELLDVNNFKSTQSERQVVMQTVTNKQNSDYYSRDYKPLGMKVFSFDKVVAIGLIEY